MTRRSALLPACLLVPCLLAACNHAAGPPSQRDQPPSSVGAERADSTRASDQPPTSSPSTAAQPVIIPNVLDGARDAAPALELVLTIRGDPYPLADPNAVAVGPDGTIYIGESGGSRVHLYDKDGAFLARWGGRRGNGDGQFDYITALALDTTGAVYVCDFNNIRVQVFDRNGAFLRSWATEPPVGPAGITIDRHDNVYVVNHTNHEHYVQKFDRTGRLLHAWGNDGVEDGQFFARARGGPEGIGLDERSATYLYLTDADNYRVQKFDAEGNFVTKLGGQGDGPGRFTEKPYGLAVDGAGNVYVSTIGATIHKFGPDGQPLATWKNTGATRMIAVDRDGNLYVRDRPAQSIKKYRQRS